MPETPTKNEELLALAVSPTAPIVVRLLKQPIPDGVASVAFVDLVECDFSGYEAITELGLDTVEVDDDLIGQILSEELAWTYEGDLNGEQTVYAVAVTRHPPGANEVLHVHQLPVPVVLHEVGQQVKFQVRLVKADLPEA